MGTAVAERKGGAVARAASYTAALYGLNDGGGDFDGRPLLRLKDGEWLFGEADDILEAEDVLAVNSRTIKQGWICFNDKNELVETEDGVPADFLWPVEQALDEDEVYDEHPLPEVKGKRATPHTYKLQVALDLVVVKGPNKGTELVYKTTSTGGKRMVAKLAGEIGRRIDNDDEREVPLVALWSESYWNRQWKKDIWNPKFDLLDWVTPDTYEWDGEDDDGPQKHPRPGETDKHGEPIDKRRKSRKADEDDDRPARKTRASKKAAREPEPEPEEELDEDEDDGEDEAPRGRSRRADTGRTARGKPARGAGRRVEPEPDDDDGEEEPAPRGRTRRAAKTEDDEPRGRGGRGSGSRGRRGEPEPDDTEDDADEAPRGRRASRGSRPASGRGQR